jgi:hypothetical protein
MAYYRGTQPEKRVYNWILIAMTSHVTTLGVSPFQDWTHLSIARLFPNPYCTTKYDSCISLFHLSTLSDVGSLSTHVVIVLQVPPCNHITLIVLRYRHFRSGTLYGASSFLSHVITVSEMTSCVHPASI